MAADRKSLEAAATWYVQFQSEPPSAAQQQAWQHWMASDPAHQAAWNQMEQLQRGLGMAPVDVTRRALSTTRPRRQVLKLLLLLPASGYLGFSAWEQLDIRADYRTAVGQRRQIELADGSRVDLNTDTAIDVRFDAAQRLIHLRHGELLVRTGKRGDPRPFMVRTAQGDVQALGTQFTVRQLDGLTHVGVLQDVVRIVPQAAVDNTLLLKAGESVDFDSRMAGTVDIYRGFQAAWAQGQLIVLDARLGDVIAELSRYRRGILHCAASAADLRVSGTFRLDAIDAVLANLQSSLPVEVRYYTRYWALIRRTG